MLRSQEASLEVKDGSYERSREHSNYTFQNLLTMEGEESPALRLTGVRSALIGWRVIVFVYVYSGTGLDQRYPLSLKRTGALANQIWRVRIGNSDMPMALECTCVGMQNVWFIVVAILMHFSLVRKRSCCF